MKRICALTILICLVFLAALSAQAQPVGSQCYVNNSNSNPVPVSDAGGTLSVDGTLTCNAGTGTFDVDVVANSIGLSTSANQSTMITSLSNIETDTGTIAGAVSGSEMQCDIVANATDFATETTLASRLAETTFTSEDFAQESGGNLDTISGDTTSIDGKITTADADTGAGTDNRQAVSLCLAESGGCTVVGSANPIPISAASLPLPTGAATEATLSSLNGKVTTVDTDDVQQATHDNLNLNANMQVADADVSATNPMFCQGPDAEGGTFDSNPFVMGGEDIFGNAQPMTAYIAGSLYTVVSVVANSAGNQVMEVNNSEAYVGGGEQHGAADDGYPIKWGGKAQDLEPDTEGLQLNTAVDDEDRTDGANNIYGQPMPGRLSQYELLTELDGTITGNTKTSSSAYELWHYTKCGFYFCLESNGSPTRIKFELESRPNPSGVWHVYAVDFWDGFEYEDQLVASELCKYFPFESVGYETRISYTCTGCNGSGNEFVLDDTALFCHN